MPNKDTDWLRISLELSRNKPDIVTDEKRIANLLLSELSSFLPIKGSRIWTLHEIVGDQQIFYESSRRERNDGNKQRPVADGLIGLAIEENKTISAFPNVHDEKYVGRYIQGWELCKSELIILIHDQTNVIGVINIESNESGDFDFDKFDEECKEQLDSLFILIANHISVLFKNRKVHKQNKSSEKLIGILSGSIYSINDLRNAVDAVFEYLIDSENMAMHAALYLSHPNNEEQFFLISEKKSKGDGNPAAKNINWNNRGFFYDIPKTIPHKSIDEVKAIFGDAINNREVLFAGSNFSKINKKFNKGKFFIVVLVSKSNSINIDKVEEVYEAIKKVLNRYLKNLSAIIDNRLKILRTNMYRIVLRNDNFSKALEKIAIEIAKNTSTEITNDTTNDVICLIYLEAPDDYHYSREKFYLGGASKVADNLQNIRISNEDKIISEASKSKLNKNYEIKEQSDDINDYWQEYLQNLNFKSSEVEVFVLPLFLKDIDISIGIILLFREKKEIFNPWEDDSPSISQILSMAEDWIEDISNIIYLEKERQADNILAVSYEKLVNILPSFSSSNSIDDFIEDFQIKIKDKILPEWKDVLSEAYFVTYKRTREDSRLKMIGERGLGLHRKTRIEVPTFRIGIGLTGSVLEKGEIYEPFVEDVKKQDKKDKYHSEHVIPDDDCKRYWDDVLGDGHRMQGNRIKISSRIPRPRESHHSKQP